MLMILIQKEILHHVLSVRFVSLLLMSVLLLPLTLSINYHKYNQKRVDYQEAMKRSQTELAENPPNAQDPNTEVSQLFLKPTPLSTFANGLEMALPTYLGLTRNGVRQGSTGLAQASVAYVLGNLDFLFIVGTVFSLLALLFTFDAVAGEREAGTLRINLSNPLPRDVFLWSKLIGGYIVFVVPFLVSFLLGLLLITLQGFPLGEFEVVSSVFCLTMAALLYIAVFFAIGVFISTYFDDAKTALIVAFTFWVFVVLVAPRGGFVIAKLVAPTRTQQTFYMEKRALRNNLTRDKEDKIGKRITETMAVGGSVNLMLNDQATQRRLDELRTPIEEEFRLKFQNQLAKINREYQREKERQEQLGEMLSRLSPTSSFSYIATNLTQTGRLKRDLYFQTGERYYKQLENTYFSDFSDGDFTQLLQLAARMDSANKSEKTEILPPPTLTEPDIFTTVLRSSADVCLLAFFTLAFITGAFLKFFRSDI